MFTIFVVALINSQNWIEVRLSTGNVVSISGTEASPSVIALLGVAAIAVFLGIYLKNRSAIAALLAGLAACLGAVFAIAPLVFEANLQVAEQEVAKATGVQGWSAQLESVVAGASITPMVTVSFVILAISILLQSIGITNRFRSVPSSEEHSKSPTVKHADADLWSETSN